MGTMTNGGRDVVTFLKEQHREIKALFTRVTATHGKEREKAFHALRRLLAVHETAEEEIVHPAARRVLPDGKSIVDARLREEKQAKTALADLERLEVDSPQFEAKLRTLEASVLAHAESEEREEFAQLSSRLEQPRLKRMRRAVELAEAVAPTRPHPGIESAAANIIAGPFAAMVDRVRDALSSRA